MDWPPLSPRQKQGGVPCEGLRDLPGTQLHGQAPGQRVAVAAIEVGTRLMSRNNKVAIHWVPAHQGNETADEMARAAAEGNLNHPDDALAAPDELRWEASLSHMTRVATENRSGISSRTGDPRRKYMAPRGKGLRRRVLRRTPKSIAGRHYQLLPCHAAIGPYLKDKICKTDDDRCWWCGGGKR